VVAATQHRGPPKRTRRRQAAHTYVELGTLPRNCLVRPTVDFLYGGVCLLYRVANHLFRGIFADATVGEMQCLRDERMNDSVTLWLIPKGSRRRQGAS
jgi:hypothetical protein